MTLRLPKQKVVPMSDYAHFLVAPGLSSSRTSNPKNPYHRSGVLETAASTTQQQQQQQQMVAEIRPRYSSVSSTNGSSSAAFIAVQKIGVF